MIKKLLLSICLIALPFCGLDFSPAFAANPNLIANPSVEVLDSSKSSPVDWSFSSWGTNTTTHSVTATSRQEGIRSVTINMLRRTNGDAKWYFKPVPVSAGTEYTYTDYYHSNVPTELVVQFTHQGGRITYQSLGTVQKNLGWGKSDFSFTAPQYAINATVFHLINKIGYLGIDNCYLGKQEPTPTTPPVIITDNVPNSSVEQSVNSLPQDWLKGGWGNNTATLSYLNEGHTGTKSLKTEITNYIDGDAKWYFTPQKLIPNTTYQFSDFYKSDIASSVVLQINKTDGTTNYQYLKDVGAASTWTQYKDTFTTPTNISTLTVFHLIASVGFLMTDDFSITPFVAPAFSQPLIAITFDDGWKSQYTNGLPILSKYQMLATYYLTSNFLEQPEYLTKLEVNSLKMSGGEIASHSVTHPFLTQSPLSSMLSELTQSKTDLENDFGKINSFSLPYDDYNDTVINSIKTYYSSARISDTGYNNINNFDAYRLKTQNISSTTTVTELNSWIVEAKASKSLLVLLYHQVDNNGGAYSVTPENFDLQMSAIKSSGIKTSTISQAMAELTPQLIK